MANETWIRGPSTSAKISGSESASDCGPQLPTTHHRQFSALPLVGLTLAAGSGVTDD